MAVNKCFLSLILTICALTSHVGANTLAQKFQKKTTEFAFDLYKSTIADHPNENVIISPLSIETVLALTYMGATGETAYEMARTMRLTDFNKTTLANVYDESLTRLENSPGLQVANKIYLKSSIKSEFQRASRKFHATAEPLDFSRSTDAAATINRWVESKTNGKIQDLIAEDSLDASTQMVLVNAVYFKALWEHPFTKSYTTKRTFWTSETESKDLDMMSVDDEFLLGFSKQLDAYTIDLKYANSDISMFVMLPIKRSGLAFLESQLGEVDFKNLTSQTYKDEVYVWLPRFKIEFKVQLRSQLQKMGMERMFTDSAEFGDLLEGDEPLKVSQVVHKAVFEVNEEGAEAAAASGAQIVPLSAKPEFIADHPFVFFLKQNDQILFMGRFLQ